MLRSIKNKKQIRELIQDKSIPFQSARSLSFRPKKSKSHLSSSNNNKISHSRIRRLRS